MTRSDVINRIRYFSETDNKILAAYESGSKATGNSDDFSDLDLVLICKEGYKENLFDKIDKYLDQKYTIIDKYRLPEPTLHKHSQTFYHLRDVPKFFYLDLVIMEESEKNHLAEIERHGNPDIWFDPQKLIQTDHIDKEAIAEKCRTIIKTIKKSYFIEIIETKKRLHRGHIIDAMITYNGLLFRRLALLLNIKYRPCKYDFSLRYSYRDYQESVNRKLKELLRYKTKDELQQGIREIEEMIEKLLSELEN